MPLGGDTPGDFQHIGKKKKKKPVLVKGEQHSGGSKVPHGGGGGGGGGPHPAEGGRGPSEQHGISHGSPGVRRKQRKLRAHGFHIRVDGIWGARSQAAWIAFQEQRRQARQRRAVRRTASSATRSYYRSLRIRSQAMARGLAEQRRRAAAEAERIQSISAVEDVRIGESNRRRREEIHTRAVARALSISRDQGRTALRGYGVTRAHPASAKNLSLHELTRIVSDPSSPWNPQRAQDVRMVQRWLRAHGFERLDVDGVFGPQTFESLVKATERAEARQRRHDVAQVRDRFYKSGIISVGDAIPFLGVAPKPGQLLKILQKGGFTASLLLRWLERRGQELGPFYVDPQFTKWRREFLDQEIAKRFGDWSMPFFGYNDYGRRARLPANYGVFWEASNFGELETLLRRQEREEKRLLEERLRQEQERGFWGNVMHEAFDALNYPVTKVKENLLAEQRIRNGQVDFFTHVYDSIALNVADITGYNLPNLGGEMDYTEALAASRATWTEFEDEHPWMNLAIEVALDPLNLVGAGFVKAAVKIPFKSLAIVAKTAERGGVALDDLGRFRNISKAMRAPIETGRWADRSFDRFVDSAGWHLRGTAAHAGWNRAADAYTKLARTKQAALQVVRAKSRQAMRLGFNTVTGLSSPGRARELSKLMANISADTRQALDVTDQVFSSVISLPNSATLKFLSENRISLAADDLFGEYTSVGWQMRSRIASELEGEAVKRTAREEARKIAAVAEQDDEKLLFLRRKGRHKEADKYLAAIESKHFEQMLRDYGSWFVGGGDPAMIRRVRDRLDYFISELDDVVMPAWQKHIEETVGHGELFDDLGRWRGAGGSFEREMRALARFSLDFLRRIVIRNPNFGKSFDRETMEFLIGDELYRRGSTLRAYESIERSAGRPREEGWVDEMLLKDEREIRGWWEPAGGDKFTDTRETLAVPALYLRHLYGTIYDDVRIYDVPIEHIVEALDDNGVISVVGQTDTFGTMLTSFDEEFSFEAGNFAKAVVVGPDAKGRARAPQPKIITDDSIEGEIVREAYDVFLDAGRAADPGFGLVGYREAESLDLVIQGKRHGVLLTDKSLIDKASGEGLIIEMVTPKRSYTPEIWVAVQDPGRLGRILKLAQERVAKLSPPPSKRMVAEVAEEIRGEFRKGGWPDGEALETQVNLQLKARGYVVFRGPNARAHSDAFLARSLGYSDEEIAGLLYRRYWNVVEGVPEDFREKLVDLSRVEPERGPRPRNVVDIVPSHYQRTEMDAELSRFRQWFAGAPVDYDELSVLDEGVPGSPFAKGLSVNHDIIRYREALSARRDTLRKAYNETLSASLRQEWAFWSALANTQRNWAKGIYWAAYGPMAAWRFSVLALRPGWTARNVADNTVKMILNGVTDPRLFFVGAREPGKGVVGRGVKSLFDVGFYAVKAVVRFLDRLFGTNALAGVQAAEDAFWALNSRILKRIFWMYDVHVPRSVVEETRFMRPTEDDLSLGAQSRARDAVDTVTPTAGLGSAAAARGARRVGEWTRETLWEVMGNRPENFARRTLYRSTFIKERKRLIRDGLTPDEAEHEAAIRGLEAVHKTLFDYSAITVADENLRAFFPFIYFWRKNVPFWANQFIEKPWFLADIDKFEDALATQNEDLPPWMRRYVRLGWFSDAVARVPGLSWLAPHLEDIQYDPLNFTSLGPLYRLFKAENELLPDDEQGFVDGLPFIGGFVSAIEESGLGMNPLIRKPLEAWGVLSLRNWQTMFPQTSLVQVFTQKFWKDTFPNGLNIEAMLLDPLLEAMGKQGTADAAADRFDEFVQREMAGQVARGERPSRAKAEEKIRNWFLVQTVVGYFSGAYLRRATPQDIYLAQIAEALRDERLDFLGLSEKDQMAYSLFKRRGWDEVAFDEYVTALPLVQAYYQLEDYAAKERFKASHPEILMHVEPVLRGDLPSADFIKTQSLVVQTDEAMRFYDFVRDVEIDRETWKVAESALVTPELRRWWASNDTPSEVRRKMIRGEYYRYLNQLSQTFFAFPEGDFEAREGFLREHPELERWWADNNSRFDDFRAIINHANADLRDRYFEFVEAGDWGTAGAFLKRFPFIFEFTKAADKVVNGEWVGDGGFPRGGFRSQHARDYLRAKRWLDLYFSMSETERNRWLNGGSQGAQIVRAYFAKYSDSQGMSQHARDFLAVRADLNRYFSMPQSKRAEWLHSPAGRRVLAYFKRYGKTAKSEKRFRALAENDPLFKTRNAELRRRLVFWHRYFRLDPDKRPLFVMRNAEKYGVFVYGLFGAKERHDREQQWLRRAMHAGLSKRAAHFLRVKPLLDFFFTLTDKFEKQLFLRANPDLQSYLDHYARGSVSGNPKLDKLLERYFALPFDSDQRSTFLREHPEVQVYFDKRSTPAERAIRSLLNVYFEIDDPYEREQFLRQHPEVQDYFDQRQRERSFETEQLQAFDEADPRFSPFLDLSRFDLRTGGERMRDELRRGRFEAPGLESRVVRRGV